MMPGRKSAVHRRATQLQLQLPAVAKESPLREAFRRAELARLGLEFRAVHSHPQGAFLLRGLAEAFRKSDEGAQRRYAGYLIRMRSELR